MHGFNRSIHATLSALSIISKSSIFKSTTFFFSNDGTSFDFCWFTFPNKIEGYPINFFHEMFWNGEYRCIVAGEP